MITQLGLAGGFGGLYRFWAVASNGNLAWEIEGTRIVKVSSWSWDGFGSFGNGCGTTLNGALGAESRGWDGCW